MPDVITAGSCTRLKKQKDWRKKRSSRIAPYFPPTNLDLENQMAIEFRQGTAQTTVLSLTIFQTIWLAVTSLMPFGSKVPTRIPIAPRPVPSPSPTLVPAFP